MLRLLVPVIILLIAVGLAVVTDRPQPRADFTFINRDIGTLDLQRMSWMQDLRVARIIFEGLTRTDVFSHEYRSVPGVAERWDISPDGTVYTFHLRPDARWSNGEPVRAGDFVYAWRRAMLPDTASDYFKLFGLIKGADEFYAWRQAALAAFRPPAGREGSSADDLWRETLAKFDEMVQVHALDDRTFRVGLKRRVPYFLDLTSFAVFYPVYPPLVQQYERVDPETGRVQLDQGWTKPPRLVSNGPFELVSWRFKREMRFEQNEHYWDRASLNVRTIAIPSVEDPNAQVLAFNSGAVDWVSDVSPSYRGDMYDAKQAFYREHWDQYQALKAQGLDPVEIDRRLPRDPRNTIHTFPAFGTYFYNFNCRPFLNDGRPNPFADARVRRAFAMAIDKERLVRDVRRIGEPVATTLVPPGAIAGYESPPGVAYDPAGARRLLAEAGYPDGRGLMPVEILFNRDAGHDVIAQAVAKDWQQKLGVRVVLAQKEVKVYRNDLKNHNFMVTRAGWFGDYGDPSTFLELSRTGDGNNDRGYANSEYDALLDAANVEPDPDRRLAILTAAESMIMDRDLPMVPLFHYSLVFLFDPHRLSGISSHPRQIQNMYLADILGDGIGADVPLALPPRPPGKGARALGGAARTEPSPPPGTPAPSDAGEEGRP